MGGWRVGDGDDEDAVGPLLHRNDAHLLGDLAGIIPRSGSWRAGFVEIHDAQAVCSEMILSMSGGRGAMTPRRRLNGRSSGGALGAAEGSLSSATCSGNTRDGSARASGPRWGGGFPAGSGRRSWRRAPPDR